MLVVLSIIVLFVILAGIGEHSRSRHSRPNIHFCNDGMKGHERRVAEFYGDDLDEFEKEWNAREELNKKLQHLKDGESTVIDGVTYTKRVLKAF